MERVRGVFHQKCILTIKYIFGLLLKLKNDFLQTQYQILKLWLFFELIILWINRWTKMWTMFNRSIDTFHKMNPKTKFQARSLLRKFRKLDQSVNLVVLRAKEGGKKIQIKLKLQKMQRTNNLKDRDTRWNKKILCIRKKAMLKGLLRSLIIWKKLNVRKLLSIIKWTHITY